MYQYFHLICVSLHNDAVSYFKMHYFIFKTACDGLVTFLSYISEIESVSKYTYVYVCNNSEYMWETISLMSVNCTLGSCTTSTAKPMIFEGWIVDCI